MSAKAEKAAITVCTVILVILAVIGVFIIAAWAIVTLGDLDPVTTAQAYVNTVTTKDGEERYFMEIEYWENADGKGKEVFEFTFNAYADINMQTVTGKGIQFVSGENRQGLEDLVGKFASIDDVLGVISGWDTYAYDVDDYGGSWASTDEVEFGDKMYLDIGDVLYAVAMDGTYTVEEQSFNLGKSIVNGLRCIFSDWNGFNHDENWWDTHVYEYEYTMKDFYNEVLYAAAHNNKGYGSSVLNLVNLGKYMSVYEFNDNGQLEEVTSRDINDVYFAVKVTRHREGFRRAAESNFGQLLGDQFFTTVDSDNYYNDYSSTAVLPTLTGADFDYYEASEPGGYIAVIKPEVLEDITARGVREVVVDLNVNDSYFGGNTQLIGVATSSFGGLKLKELRVTLYQDTEDVKPFYIFESNTFESVTGLAIDDVELTSVGRYDSAVQLVLNRFLVQLTPDTDGEEVAA